MFNPTAPQLTEGETRRRCDASAPLTLTVVFTTPPATAFAVKRGLELAREVGASLRILVPNVVPYPDSLFAPRSGGQTRLKPLLSALPCDVGEVRIDVLVSRDSVDAILRSLQPNSMILMASHKRWWRRKDLRLSRRLEQAGHDVLFLRTGSKVSVSVQQAPSACEDRADTEPETH